MSICKVPKTLDFLDVFGQIGQSESPKMRRKFWWTDGRNNFGVWNLRLAGDLLTEAGRVRNCKTLTMGSIPIVASQSRRFTAKSR